MWSPLTKIVESTEIVQGFAMAVSNNFQTPSLPGFLCSNTYSNDLANFCLRYTFLLILFVFLKECCFFFIIVPCSLHFYLSFLCRECCSVG